MRWAGSYRHQTALILVRPNSILPKSHYDSRIAVLSPFNPIVKNLPYYLLKYMLFHLGSFCRFGSLYRHQYKPLQYTRHCCFPVTLATEAIAFSISRWIASPEAVSRSPDAKVCYDSLIIFSSSAQNRSRSCLDCYMLLKFLRVVHPESYRIYYIILPEHQYLWLTS